MRAGTEVAELESRIELLKAELTEARGQLVAREAPLRTVLVAQESAVATLRDEAHGLRVRIEAYKTEASRLGAPRPSVITQAPRCGLICVGLFAFFAGAESLPDKTPQVIVFGIGAFIATVVWGLLHE